MVAVVKAICVAGRVMTDGAGMGVAVVKESVAPFAVPPALVADAIK
jgi:hypothetical protein